MGWGKGGDWGKSYPQLGVLIPRVIHSLYRLVYTNFELDDVGSFFKEKVIHSCLVVHLDSTPKRVYST